MGLRFFDHAVHATKESNKHLGELDREGAKLGKEIGRLDFEINKLNTEVRKKSAERQKKVAQLNQVNINRTKEREVLQTIGAGTRQFIRDFRRESRR